MLFPALRGGGLLLVLEAWSLVNPGGGPCGCFFPSFRGWGLLLALVG